jgi:hypothetical protein
MFACVSLCADIHRKVTVFESIVSFHLLVEYMMEEPDVDKKKRKIVVQNNVSKYCMNGV